MLAAIAPVSGDTAHAGSTFTVRYTIFNTGQALSRDFHVTIRYCPSAAPTGCVDLGGTLITDDFGVDEGRVYDSPALTLPGVVQYGRRYIRVRETGRGRTSVSRFLQRETL